MTPSRVRPMSPRVLSCVLVHVLPKKKKTPLDAKDGYHSVIFLELDQEYSEFLWEFGRYRCVGSGQGLICSGDAYTARFDKITQDFNNVVRCVDDSLIWGDNVRDMFDSTSRYISVCEKGGINFNKKKFRYSKDEVEYMGFKVSKDAIIPADSMTESIRNFPQPKNITDARAFFGLAEQVSFAF